jgi:glycerophosphoryl diester phosphodiesterase
MGCMTTHRVNVFSAAVCAVLALAVITPAGAASADVACIAHRGGESSHTEETLPTYADNIAAGVTEIEGDVRFTSTGYPMMLHDADLGEFGAPTLLLANLGTGAAKSHESPTHDVIATLYEVRTLLLANPSVKAQLEMKETMTSAMWDMLASRVAVLGNRVTITSFSLTTVRQAQDRGYRTGLLSSTDSITTAAPTFIVDVANLESDDVARHSEAGVATQVYTPDTVTAWNTARAAGVSAIITNKPLECATWSATP